MIELFITSFIFLFCRKELKFHGLRGNPALVEALQQSFLFQTATAANIPWGGNLNFYQRSYSIITNVCPSSTFRGKRDFLGSLLRQTAGFFSVHIPVINEHIFYKYFVRQNVSLSIKGRNVKIQNAVFSTHNSDDD